MIKRLLTIRISVIVNNEFYCFDYAVLFAQSVEGLQFENNKLIRSYDFKPYHRQKATFTFSGCKKVTIKNNIVDKDILGKNIRFKFMDKREINLQKEFVLDQTEKEDTGLAK